MQIIIKNINKILISIVIFVVYLLSSSNVFAYNMRYKAVLDPEGNGAIYRNFVTASTWTKQYFNSISGYTTGTFIPRSVFSTHTRTNWRKLFK